MTDMQIAYFITSHGFGHASRACAVMQSMQQANSDIHFHIYTAIPEWLFVDSGIRSFTHHNITTDIGLIQHSPFDIDYEETIERLGVFYEQFNQMAQIITEQIRYHNIKAVLCDVAVLGIAVAKAAHIPSFLIENFTWDWIYEFYQTEFPAFEQYKNKIRGYNEQVTHHYLTEPFCQYPRSLKAIAKPISRRPRQDKATTRSQLNISRNEKVVLLSLGGIPDQMQINAASLQKKGLIFLVPGIGNEITRDGNTIFLPQHSQFYHPDLVTAADAVIAKVGYSTIAEVFHANIPMGYIPRSDFPESKDLSAYIKHKMHGTEIKLADFLSGQWVQCIDPLISTAVDYPNAIHGADQICEWVFSEL